MLNVIIAVYAYCSTSLYLMQVEFKFELQTLVEYHIHTHAMWYIINK